LIQFPISSGINAAVATTIAAAAATNISMINTAAKLLRQQLQ
jgi:hypothetical protein